MPKKFYLVLLIIISMATSLQAQDFVEDLILSTDSANFSLNRNTISYRRSNYLYFVIDKLDEIINIKVIPREGQNIRSMGILTTSSIVLVDSLIRIEDGSFTGSIRMIDAIGNPHSRLVLNATVDGVSVNRSIRLYPYLFPKIPKIEPLIEVYSGQDVRLPLPIINPQLIEYDDNWQKQGIIEYQIQPSGEGPILALRATRSGVQDLRIKVASSKPFLTEDGLITYDLFDLNLGVKSIFSKVNYLNFDKLSYYFEPEGSKLISVRFDNNRNIKLNRTYRIEDQEEPGGRLIGELFTRAIIENQDKVVATLRTYALHRIEDGYLYMKLGDQTNFFTNFNILQKPTINKLSILRPSKDWNASPTVYPGETVELKFEGVGLEDSEIKLSDGKYSIEVDTSRMSENVMYCNFTIPVDVRERTIPITLNGNNTSFELLVQERERPRQLDFVTLNYGKGEKVINGETFITPALFPEEIGDLVIRFDENSIDEPDIFYGIQYLEIEIRYWDKNKKLIESRKIEDLKIVPGKGSIRYAGYSRANASNPMIKVNDIMVNKTHELRPWSQIEITVRHDKSKYGGEGFSQHVQIYRSDNFTVDIEVSFPAGLLAKKLNEPGIGTLTGLSVASMANFSFYKKNQINKLQPFRIGAGFVMLNAFSSLTSSSGESQDDIGMVILSSFRPLKPDSKINFPLYAGFGYLFKSEALFLLIGPGIQFNF